MSNVPDDLGYTAEHEYVARTDDPAVVKIGITDYAQGELGDVVFVRLPKTGERLDAHQSFGEIEAVIQQRIDQNRGKVRVAADLSEKGIAEIKAEERMQGELAEQALQNFEVELGLRSPETTPVAQSAKDLGPAAEKIADKALDKQTN